jgi:uncharacterized protein (DUF1800 family)
MVEFWSNHLNITCPHEAVWDSRHHFDAHVVRAHALGRYADMLQAAIPHPAMLTYLNNASSTKAAPNENLGRELLELHTVGVEAGYTQADVVTCARILTGLSIDYKTGEFLYRPRSHWTGPVSVLGFTSANASADGAAVVTALLDHLARLPATARRIARKLAVRFVADVPPPALVERLAQVYLASDTAIVPVLRALFTSAEFAASADRKSRRPFEAMAATVRTLGLKPSQAGTDLFKHLSWSIGDQGHVPLAWAQPDGYPDTAAAWQSTAATLARWNMNLNLAAGWWPTGFVRDPLTGLLPRTLPRTHGQLVTALAARLLHRPLPVASRDALCAFLEVQAATPLTRTSPAVTWRLPYLVALLLDTPAHMAR